VDMAEDGSELLEYIFPENLHTQLAQ
jgi:hypothetical protein